jgi:hypothetical protein
MRKPDAENHERQRRGGMETPALFAPGFQPSLGVLSKTRPGHRK